MNDTVGPRQVVESFLAFMERLDYERALTLVAEDVEYTNIPLGTVRGPAGIRAVLEPFFAPTISNQWVISKIVEQGSTIVVERVDRHQLAGGWVELPVVGIFEIRDDLIAAWRDYFDLATIQDGFAAHTGGSGAD